MQIELFEDIRNWGAIRGLAGEDNPQVQMYRLLEEVSELHKAVTTNDIPEVKDAIGDIIVVLTQLSKNYDGTVEDFIQGAFKVIKHRKGLTKDGTFIRYAKLSNTDKIICDEKQGNPGSEFLSRHTLENATPDVFER